MRGKAHTLGLADSLVARENDRLLCTAAFLSGDLAGARAAAIRLAQVTQPYAVRLDAEDWLERIQLDFEEQALAGRTLTEIGVRSGDQIVVGRPWLTTQDLGIVLSIVQIAISSLILIRTF